MKSASKGVLVRFLFLGVAVGLFLPLPAWGARRKVIVDQDGFGPGGTNMQSLLLLLQSPDIEVLGITIVSGDGWNDENVAHTLRMLELVGRTDVPVYSGATFPLVNSQEATKRWEAIHGKLIYKGAWMENTPDDGKGKRPVPHGPFEVPPLQEGQPTTKPADGIAADFLVRETRRLAGEISIIAMGPLTNLALAARLDNDFARRAKELVVMGGSFEPRAAGNEFAAEYRYTPRLEFNFRWDPEAARIVLHSPWRKITQVPLDPTTKTFMTEQLMKKATASQTAVGKYVAQYYQPLPMWDELAVGVLVNPEIVTNREKLLVDVDIDANGAGYGNTLCWPVGGAPGLGEREVEVVRDVDVAKFEQWFVATLDRVGSQMGK
jgi:inosine-uridine nucleoside N-ribohydrolase